ncbi:MAG: NADP-dependent phosphogluconate dehydrogenase, partial [Planctomycetes bacterium]|nr:NADP-dependent phosphogluconate dehydrogenase [Planctomycetota bacterium]
MSQQHIGVVGMDVMGSNLALNIESKGFPVAVYNRTAEKTKKFVEQECVGKKVMATYSIPEFVGALERPRRILLMVKAGPPVDEVIQQTKPHLGKDDILIDGGNSYYKDTARRNAELAKDGLMYIGTGVSGGEEGALKGPCIMPGGQREAYNHVESVLCKIAAQVDDGPCCAYIGPGAAGHYVKMVHNGIEYGDMQLIAEAYNILRMALGMSATEMQPIFAEWNRGLLSSYLIEITANILAKTDPDTGKPVVDIILDKAGQKGTGKWTSQDSLDLGVAIPTIDAALTGRNVS